MEIRDFWRSANLHALARAPIEVDGRLYWSGQYAEWLMRAAPLTHVAIYPTYSREIRLISKCGRYRSTSTPFTFSVPVWREALIPAPQVFIKVTAPAARVVSRRPFGVCLPLELAGASREQQDLPWFVTDPLFQADELPLTERYLWLRHDYGKHSRVDDGKAFPSFKTFHRLARTHGASAILTPPPIRRRKHPLPLDPCRREQAIIRTIAP